MSRQTMKPDAVGVGIIFTGVIQRQTPGTLKLPAAGSWLCSVMWACVLITPPYAHILTHSTFAPHIHAHRHVYTLHTSAYIHAYIHTTYSHHTQIHAYIHTTYTHTRHIHTHIHSYTHTPMHTHTLPVHTIHIDTYTAHTTHTYILSG